MHVGAFYLTKEGAEGDQGVGDTGTGGGTIFYTGTEGGEEGGAGEVEEEGLAEETLAVRETVELKQEVTRGGQRGKRRERGVTQQSEVRQGQQAA